jgi:hypothetical protein
MLHFNQRQQAISFFSHFNRLRKLSKHLRCSKGIRFSSRAKEFRASAPRHESGLGSCQSDSTLCLRSAPQIAIQAANFPLQYSDLQSAGFADTPIALQFCRCVFEAGGARCRDSRTKLPRSATLCMSTCQVDLTENNPEGISQSCRAQTPAGACWCSAQVARRLLLPGWFK